jgi:hypothetical protein
MFKEYKTIDEVMNGEGRDLVKQALNSTDLYIQTVESLGYSLIEIAVLDPKNRKIGSYTSCNNKNGEIETIIVSPENSTPNIAVKVEERYLMEILHNIETVKTHPFRSFIKYARKFKPRRRQDRQRLVCDLPKLVTSLYYNMKS